MPTLHVERSIQFRSDLYSRTDRSGWFREMGNELAARRLSITVAPGLVITNGDQAVAFYNDFRANQLGSRITLPPGVTIQNYFWDLVQALDDVVKPTSDVADRMLDFNPAGEFARLLGLDTRSFYASRNTPVGRMAVDGVATVDGVSVVKQADPLAGVPYIDAATFQNQQYTWTRDATELEQVYGVSGVDAMDLLRALRATNNAGRSTFQRLRRPEIAEAYTVGYSGVSLDDMRWDSDSHRMREANKYVSLTIEGGRFEVDPASGQRELSIGTDKMDDVYLDTADWRLRDADILVRARARWDTDTEIRRLLVGVKFGSVVDDQLLPGMVIKRNGKVDTRNDNAQLADVRSLENDVRRGMVGGTWTSGGAPAPLMQLKGAYDAVNGPDGRLPDIGGHQDVLLLEGKAYLRSIRSRFHLNESSLQSLQNFYQQTTGKLNGVLDLAAQVKPALSGANLDLISALEAQGLAIRDGTAIAAAAEARLRELDPAMTVTADAVRQLMPNATGGIWSGTADQLTIEKRRVVAETMDSVYHEFAEQLDGARRVLCQSEDRTYEDYPPLFMAWMKSTDTSLVSKRTYDPFLARFDQIAAMSPTDFEAQLAAFNQYGEQQRTSGNRDFRDFETMTADGFRALRAQLVNEVVRVNQRQLEAGGSAALGLWFDDARRFYVPGANRNTGNFIIDTTDMTEYYTAADWNSIQTEAVARVSAELSSIIRPDEQAADTQILVQTPSTPLDPAAPRPLAERPEWQGLSADARRLIESAGATVSFSSLRARLDSTDFRAPVHDLPIDKAIHATLVNENQIELGLERPYITRLDDLNRQIGEDVASLWMKYLTASPRPGVDPANPATYQAALREVLALPEAERTAVLSAFTDFAQAQGSPVRNVAQASRLSQLPDAAFTVANRDRAVRTTANLEQQLEGAQFIFRQLMDVQQKVVEAKGDRILRTLRSAGLRGGEWTQTLAGKGEIGLDLVREREGNQPPRA